MSSSSHSHHRYPNATLNPFATLSHNQGCLQLLLVVGSLAYAEQESSLVHHWTRAGGGALSALLILPSVGQRSYSVVDQGTLTHKSKHWARIFSRLPLSPHHATDIRNMKIVLADYLPTVAVYYLPVVIHHIYTKVKALAYNSGKVWKSHAPNLRTVAMASARSTHGMVVI